MKLDLELIDQRLSSEVSNLVLLEAVDSTHAMALRLIQQMDDEGLHLAPTVIVSAAQSAGRGRGERQWISPYGGLYMSWLRSGLRNETVARLPMLAAAAAHSALVGLGLGDATVKWPNDILVGKAKIAGILVHARHGDTVWATVGIGVNVLQAPAIRSSDRPPATSIADQLGDTERAAELGIDLAERFIAGLHASIADPQPALRHWREALQHSVGDSMTLRLASGDTVTGRLLAVSEEGFLRLGTARGERTITGGDVIESG